MCSITSVLENSPQANTHAVYYGTSPILLTSCMDTHTHTCLGIERTYDTIASSVTAICASSNWCASLLIVELLLRTNNGWFSPGISFVRHKPSNKSRFFRFLPFLSKKLSEMILFPSGSLRLFLHVLIFWIRENSERTEKHSANTEQNFFICFGLYILSEQKY